MRTPNIHTTKITWPPNPPSKIKIYQEACHFWTSPIPKRKGISFFYNCMHGKLTLRLFNPLLKWASEINVTITEHQRQKAIVNNLSASKCTTYWEMGQKIHLRWYYKPYKVVKCKSEHSNQCWQSCVLVGTLSHLLWFCPNIRSYWNSVFRLTTKLTGFITRPNIRLAILSIGIEKFPSNLKHVVKHTLFAAWLILIRKWKSNIAPNVGEVINFISKTYTLEQVMAYKHGCLAKFYMQWSSWRELHK